MGAMEGVIASLGVVEALVGAARVDDGARFELAAATIRDLGFTIAALDADTAEEAAWIRGRTSASLPDAVHLACARLAGATAYITNDRRIRSRPGLTVVYLDDLAADEPPP
jgi:predicted nucleic acid-binding protein